MLATGVISSVTGAVLVVLVQVVLALTTSSSVDTVLGDRADLLVAAVAPGPDGLSVPDASLGPGAVVYDDAGGLVAGEVPPSLRADFDELSGSGRATTSTVDDQYRLLARPFSTPDGARGVAVVAEPLAPYEADERAALTVVVVAALLTAGLSTGLASWATRRVLAPVAQMAAAAEDWSEHDLDRRFDLGPPRDEILALGQTLDGLLEKVARTIRGEQRLTSELAHELRTPLTAISATAELMSMRGDLDDDLRRDLEEIRRACRLMADSTSALLELARDDRPSGTRATCEVAEVVTAVLAVQDPAGRTVVEVTPGLRVQAPRELAIRALSPLVDNALAEAEHVTVRARRAGEAVLVEVEDDGPGLPPGSADDIFEPGVSHRSGTGLGLPLSRRVARSLGGDVDIAPGPGPGARFVLRLPAVAAR